ncbi:TRAP transporter small permease [Salisediminibacterium halotolerans]|uniref:C4-dicarboxylate transporter, DctM subunit n=1 Tax=Salisediminibacterium halotolerans TaxID=517425 RepID=A0A1H9UBV0_9BACI|nr:TRAP transporter small permease subunit [Salisediminibacterium haloalkalitolerans]SES06728.1 C4-dicarboxylate transporter, DctM subunit [Salisediminibacterium haloalkalitolerans]
MEKVDRIIEIIMEYFLIAALFVTVAFTFIQVFTRYVFGMSLAWSQELVLITFVYTVLFGAVICLKNDDHLKVDLLDNAPAWLLKAVRVLEFIITAVFVIVLMYFGYQLFMNNLASGTVVGILPIQQAFVYIAIPISAVFMLYFQLRKVMK